MKFLAWDVGIKNLAYSIIDYDIDTKNKTIIDWGVLNLMNDIDEIEKEAHKCAESNQNGKKCTTNVAYLFQDKPEKGLCKMHRMMIKYKPCRFLDLNEKLICSYEITNKKNNETKRCTKIGIVSRKDNLNTSYCNQHLKVVQNKTPFETYEVQKNKKKLVKTMSVLMLANRLYQHLDKLQDVLLDVDEIIIENQPVLKNPTMKTIQILLYGYFIMNGILKDKVKDIHFFSASKKLEAFDDIDNKIIGTLSHLSGQYQINKKVAILYTIEMIKKNEKWFKFFNSHNKKDDLSDAYLTNCYFIDRRFKLQNKSVSKSSKEKQKAVKKEEEKEKLDDENVDLEKDDDDIINMIDDSTEDEDGDGDGDEEQFSDSDIDLNEYFGNRNVIDSDTSKKISDKELVESMKQDMMTTKKPFRFYKFSKPKTSTPTSTPKTTIAKPRTPQVKAKNKKVEFY
jgi:hypothetical protein